MKTLNGRLVLVALLASFALSVQTRAQTSDGTGPQDAVVTITAEDIGVEPSDNGRSIGGRLLFYMARYQAGDDPAWADPTFEDQGWEIASIGLRSDILPRQGWPGIGWFRIRLRVDASLRDHDLGFVILHSGAVEAYLDGKLVHQSGTVGASRAEEDPYLDRNPFVLPLEAGREHVLALRYSSFVTEGFRARWHYTGPAVYWGERATMMHHRAFVRFNQGVFSAFFLAFALLFGLLYGLYRSERLFLYLAVYYSLLVPLAFMGSQLPFVDAPARWMPLLDAVFVFVVSTSLAMLLVLYAFFYPARPRSFYGFLLVGLAATIAVFIRLENTLLLFVFLFLVNVEVLRVVVVALWRKKRWAWIIGVGVAPGFIIALWDQLGMLGLLTTPWSSSPFNPGMIGTLFLSSAFAVYVGIRFAEANSGLAAANRALSEANRTLEDRVARRTAALQASQAQLIHAEKMASLGQLTAGVAHEIQNPLNFVNNFAEIMGEMVDELGAELETHQQEIPDGVAHDFKEILTDLRMNSAKIEKHGQRADGIIKSMLQHARPATGRRERTDINALLNEYLDLCYHSLCSDQDDCPIVFERDYDEAVGQIEVVPQEIGRVFFNLLNNASYAVYRRMDAETGGHGDAEKGYEPRITVATRRVGDTVEISITDNGVGIPKDFQKKIFEPFFTTKPTGSGTGLGLSLSYDIVTQGHSGTLTVESSEGQGATFVITVPREATSAPATDGVNSLTQSSSS